MLPGQYLLSTLEKDSVQNIVLVPNNQISPQQPAALSVSNEESTLRTPRIQPVDSATTERRNSTHLLFLYVFSLSSGSLTEVWAINATGIWFISIKFT